MDFVRHVLSRIGARGFDVGYGRQGSTAVAGGFAALVGSRRQAAILLASAFFILGTSAQAASGTPSRPACGTARCGLLTDGAYPNLVIGRLDYVGTPTDMRQVVRWAKAHGYWNTLPASMAPYLRDVKLVRISVPKGKTSHPVSLFMLRTEYDSAPYRVGDLVRYAPHDDAHDKAAKGNAADLALFHGLTGCVATLCQKGDAACFKRYSQGAFTAAQGRQISLATGHPISKGARIDPISLLPVR